MLKPADLIQKIISDGSISEKNNDLERKQYYTAVIQKLERELGRTVTPFRELKMLALKYYSDNAELFEMMSPVMRY